MTPKRIGVLTSGGDCAGLNAAIRSIALHAIQTYGWEVFGIHEGTNGLMENPLRYTPLTLEMAESLLRLGGTVLGTTNTGDPRYFRLPNGQIIDRSFDIIQGYHALNLDALIGIGGDGSQKILHDIAQKGNINLICIPKTIDNDLSQTDLSIGFSTALEVATEALDRLQPTAASHKRIMILEVMGRDAGHIALASGIAGGADIILIPEIPYHLPYLEDKIRSLHLRGRNFALVVVAEAVKTPKGGHIFQNHGSGSNSYGGIGHYLGQELTHLTGSQSRVTVLGHVQRGGSPSYMDRLLGCAFGVYAVDLVERKTFGRMLAWKNQTVTDIAIEDGMHTHLIDPKNNNLIKTARGLGICLGDSLV
jgi:6-phosphofructokinase 1